MIPGQFFMQTPFRTENTEFTEIIHRSLLFSVFSVCSVGTLIHAHFGELIQSSNRTVFNLFFLRVTSRPLRSCF